MRKVMMITTGIVLLMIAFLFFMPKEKEMKTYDFVGMTKQEVELLAKENHLHIIYEYEKSRSVSEARVIRQEKKESSYIIVLSVGDKEAIYRQARVNELGKVPIMMYHGIVNEEAKYIGGNIDPDGYNRSTKAFKEDLEFYYQEGYRMVRLYDYINGKINTALGKSPIILTFDDGNKNNFHVTGLDQDGNIIIDPNCAVGILESFKEKYPDYAVTATFFLNGSLFDQETYHEKMILWLLDHGYDIGNHSYSHVDFSKIDQKTTIREIGKQYELLSSITKDYVPIVALPFGSPYAKMHPNFSYILEGNYNQKRYITESTLRVGWDSELSPFHKDFDKSFLKRIRAYDNHGKDFDIKMVFDQLKDTRYISDGNQTMITIPIEEELHIKHTDFQYQTYQ